MRVLPFAILPFKLVQNALSSSFGSVFTSKSSELRFGSELQSSDLLYDLEQPQERKHEITSHLLSLFFKSESSRNFGSLGVM